MNSNIAPTTSRNRFTKDDLELGMIVEDRYGSQKVVSRLEPFDDDDHAFVPVIDARSFGYISTGETRASIGDAAGVSGVGNIERIVEDGDVDEEEA